MEPQRRDDLRNLAIIAHVDHGKTTLVDALLKQSHTFRDNQEVGTLIMDSNALEREKGITILAKNTAILHSGVTINIIDTPGHADFGGEVERVLNMADGCLLLVDAAEGPMPQTRFVLDKAFQTGLRPIIVINKLDRPHADPERSLEAVHDLFLELARDADQLDAPVIYTIAKQGRAGLAPDRLGEDLEPLFQAIIQHVPPPVAEDGPFRMLVANRGYDEFTGTLAIGRIFRGEVHPGDTVSVVSEEGVRPAKVGRVLLYRGLGREPVEGAAAGDIAVLTGLEQVAIGDTLADPEHPDPLPRIAIEEPTVRMTFGVNTSPMSGREGRYSTSRQLYARLQRELDTNLGLRVAPSDSPERWVVSGRGELHLSILIETMRREGYELEVSRPEAIVKVEDGRRMEPMERLHVEVREDYLGAVSEALGRRRGELKEISYDGNGGVLVDYEIPTRGLIGFRNGFLTLTGGTGVLASLPIGFAPWVGEMREQRNGALVASSTGTALTYGLANAQERGITFIEPGTTVYEGMIVGLQRRTGDMAVNVCREKKQSNVRSSTADIAVRLTPALILSLEQCLDFLIDDELLEVTPDHIRLRKRYLTEVERTRAYRRSQN
ncbi:MAG TPA: translational GTPase TypA [Candidatus Dormibacteraeota bacterium]|jgi:GTP-binding protein|nr:translational GTPase TypA [Candidatus Dormibacteraeota bacterium]